MIRDLKLGLRTALRSPGYSLVAIITMALAIGANTLLFSIANPLVVRPLPIANPDSLGWVRQVNGPQGVTIGRTSMPDFLDFRAESRSFQTLAAREIGSGTLVIGGDPTRVALMRVTANLPSVWGLAPAEGRLFLQGEDSVGSAPVAVLSYRFWRDSFNADRAVVGRTVTLDSRPLTIVGVMTPDIEFGSLAEIDIWTPLPLDAGSARDVRTLSVMGTLAPGVSLEQAHAEMQAVAARLAERHPATNTGWSLVVLDTRSAITGGDTWVILALMSVVVGFVLLIACASLANLARARLVGRAQDIDVRRALGASRAQLIAPLVSESIVLGLVGGTAGLLLAQAGLKTINAVAFEQYFRMLAIDGYVLAFNLGLSVITPLLFSVWPALRHSRPADAEHLRGTRIRGGHSSRRKGRVLIVSQVAMALSLLVVSALAVQSMWQLSHTPTGMQIDRVLSLSLDLPDSRYGDQDARRLATTALVDAVRRVPGVNRAAVVSHLPVFDPQVTRSLSGTANDGVREGERPFAAWYAVSPDFFSAVGIDVLAGRALEPADAADRRGVAVINHTAATRYFGGAADALDRMVHLHADGGATPLTIVGVVEDTKNGELVAVDPQLYVPIEQSPVATLTVVASSSQPDSLVTDLRRAIASVDAGLATTPPKTLATRFSENASSSRIITSIFLGFGALALALAAAGLYGVIAFTVSQRKQEFGVRLALGAQPGAIRTMVLREGALVSAIGVVLGLVMAALLASASSAALYGISPGDAPTYLGVTGAVVMVVLLAIWIPATRAMRVDPVTALRD